MLRSFYIAGTGMITQRNKMDVVINNITNMDTVGYKSDQLVTRSFPDLLLDRLNDPAIINRNTYVGPQNTGVHIDEVALDFTQGVNEETGEMTDIAIVGEGFFCVDTPQGVQYTRAGDFQVDQNGMLLTQEGYYVLGQGGGRINVGTNGFAVQGDGTITTMQGQQMAKLRIVRFEDMTNLRKVGNNNYLPYNNAPAIDMATPNVRQGMMEGSNVDVGRTMADMLMTNRVYESSQRMLRMVDESLAKTVSEIARF